MICKRQKREKINVNQMIKSIDSLAPGESLVYYNSVLCPLSKSGEVEIRNHAYSCYRRNTHELTQRIVGEGGIHRVFDYIITKKRYPPNPVVIARYEDYERRLDVKK